LTQLTESEKDLEKKGWLDFNSSNQTHNVGMRLPNCFGLCDMIGNVWEYTSDSFGFDRYVRGGSYTSDREWYGNERIPFPHDKFNDTGLRVFADKITMVPQGDK
jgi:formylglycine-generating enzyme required for sulfatase activity